MNSASSAPSDPAIAASPINVVKAAFACYLLADREGIEALTHPDCTWSFPGDPRVIPWAGPYRGREIRRFIDHIIDHTDYLEIRVLGFWPSGDHVFLRARERFRVRATGRICENEYAALATVRDGLVYGYHEYSDTAAMQAAFA